MRLCGLPGTRVDAFARSEEVEPDVIEVRSQGGGLGGNLPI